VAALIGHLNTRDKTKTKSPGAVQAPGGPSRVGAVMVSDSEQIEIGFLLHVAQETLDRLIAISPRVMAGVRVQISLTHG
jgi:hypothetical protein